MSKYKLYLDDALNVVKDLKEKGIVIDHIITDPPYNISKNNNFKTMKKGKSASSKGRVGIDFGNWDRDFDLFSWIKEYVDILSSNGSIIVFCSYLYMSYIIDYLEESGIDVKDVLIWKKSNPMPRNIDRRYVQDMEFIIWGVKKGAKWVFNKPEDTPYLRSLFETSLVSGNEKTIHPTQKSIKLMEHIIKIHTNAGECIIDPFMGSGTTGLACINNGRNFIGVENNEEYFKVAKQRLI